MKKAPASTKSSAKAAAPSAKNSKGKAASVLRDLPSKKSPVGGSRKLEEYEK